MAAGEAVYDSNEIGPELSHVELCLTKCNDQCAKCTYKADYCDTCNLTGDPNRLDNPPFCTCRPGFVENITTLKCELDSDICFKKVRVVSAGSADG